MAPIRHTNSQPAKRSQACLNCKRKKIRCPGEKPHCSSCTRLKQECVYRVETSSPAVRSPVEERLSLVEQQLNRILKETRESNGSAALRRDASQYTPPDSVLTSHEPGFRNRTPPLESLQKAIYLYYENCHRQPICCLDDQTIQTPTSFGTDLANSLMALTCRFSPDFTGQHMYLSRARAAIMLQISDGSVALSTLQSLCLISYSYFLDGNFHLGQFHLGLALQLCRSARLDDHIIVDSEDVASETKKRLFWTLQLLEQTYGSQSGLLQVPSQTWQVSFNSFEDSKSESVSTRSETKSSLPPRTTSATESSDIWGHTVQTGWVWSMTRRFVADAASGEMKEPWRSDSQHTEILSNLMQLETTFPLCHRYDTAKFYQRQPQDLHNHRHYWTPWLKMQFEYRAMQTILNHPFLFISVSQRNPKFSVSNTFWRKSMENGLSHATWIARIIDMVLEKQIRLTDPFFAHAAAIAATVHLYYCCATSQRLKLKSRADLMKCVIFVKSFASFSQLCKSLELSLENLIKVAAASDEVDLTSWSPSKIFLSSKIMWDILRLVDGPEASSNANVGLLHSSLQPIPAARLEPYATFEITVPTSPEVSVQISDGGQAALLPSSTTSQATPDDISERERSEIVVVPSESLKTNPAWLWHNFPDLPEGDGIEGHDLAMSVEGSAWDPAWWDFGNL